MTTTSLNYNIAPGDGWVTIAPTASKFIRVSGFPHTHPYFLYFGSSAPTLYPLAGTGTVTLATAAPSDGDTVTIGSEVYTFRTAPSLPFEVAIGATFTTAATNLTAYINLNSALVTASDASSVITVTSIVKGSVGNLALAKSGTNIAVSGALLTGGADPAVGILVCHKPFFMNITTDAKLWARIQNPVPNSNNASGTIRLDVTSIQ